MYGSGSGAPSVFSFNPIADPSQKIYEKNISPTPHTGSMRSFAHVDLDTRLRWVSLRLSCFLVTKGHVHRAVWSQALSVLVHVLDALDDFFGNLVLEVQFQVGVYPRFFEEQLGGYNCQCRGRSPHLAIAQNETDHCQSPEQNHKPHVRVFPPFT